MTHPADATNPGAFFSVDPMDPTLNRLARKQRQEHERRQARHPVLEGSFPDDSQPPDYGDELLPQPPSTNGSLTATSPSAARKGILKPPRVHFEHYDEGPPPPPPPPPPGLFPDHIADADGEVPQVPPPPPPKGAPMPMDIFLPAVDNHPYLSERANRLYSRFMEELERFVSMQGEVIRSRVLTQERREELRMLRENVSRCDASFIDHLRVCMTEGKPANDKKLQELFEAAQEARDLVGPKAAEYEPMEVKLGADEFALKEQYESLENRYDHFFRLNATSTTHVSVPSRIDFEPESTVSDAGDRELGEDQPRDYSLFQGRYIGEKVKVGQMPLPEGEPLPPEQAHPPASNTHYTPVSEVKNSSDHREAAKKLSGGDGDDRLEDLPGGAPDPASDIQEPNDLYLEVDDPFRSIGEIFSAPDEFEGFPEEMEMDQSLSDGDSLIVRSTDDETLSTLSEYLLSFDSTRDRVNRWLLHKLRVSPLEVYELRRAVLHKSPNVPDWANHVLDLWPKDSLGLGPRYHQGSIEGLTNTNKAGQTGVPAYPAISKSKRNHPRLRNFQSSTVVHPAELDELREPALSGAANIDPSTASGLRTISSR
ncbi:hypothetical protein EJ04DRAFT_553918 [Polyplosphaeria fusca]|uniref:Uncharacterized protein n=1 Tax=Polyplosphaeria fusca TaxID=682080 RepID=A0A9P4QTV4_9PLEO|nr:hypothetical protein EJ04DRAFT_553918 [Polyplosphaeria fusca]